jgi:hypothetical protein
LGLGEEEIGRKFDAVVHWDLDLRPDFDLQGFGREYGGREQAKYGRQGESRSTAGRLSSHDRFLLLVAAFARRHSVAGRLSERDSRSE